VSILTDIFRFLVFSNFWISIAAAGYSMLTVYQLDLEVPSGFYWFVGCCTLCSYCLQRYLQFSYRKKKQSIRQNWLVGNRLYVGGTILAAGIAGAILGLTILTPVQILCFIPISLISMFYSIRVLGRSKKSKRSKSQGLRGLPGVKIFMVAISWSFLCGLMPIWISGFSGMDLLQIILVCLEKLFFIIAITIPFDIRDLKYDQVSNNTIPQVFGATRSIYIANGLLLVAALCAVFSGVYSAEVLTGLMLSYATTMIVLLYVDEEKPELYYSGLIDATIVFQLLFVLGAVNLL